MALPSITSMPLSSTLSATAAALSSTQTQTQSSAGVAGYSAAALSATFRNASMVLHTSGSVTKTISRFGPIRSGPSTYNRGRSYSMSTGTMVGLIVGVMIGVPLIFTLIAVAVRSCLRVDRSQLAKERERRDRLWDAAHGAEAGSREQMIPGYIPPYAGRASHVPDVADLEVAASPGSPSTGSPPPYARTQPKPPQYTPRDSPSVP